jgi:transporter family-2 protein
MGAAGSAWAYAIIFAGGVLQACGLAMSGALNKALSNPWLASLVSFAPIVLALLVVVIVAHRPLPSHDAVSAVPWWAPLGGLIGAVEMVAGLVFVGRIGAGAVTGLSITATLLTSIVIDHFGLFRIDVHPANVGRLLGAGLMVGGIALIAKY